MDVHAHGVELLEAVHAVHEEDDGPAPLYRLYGPGQEVGRHRLKILEDAHPVCVAENLVSLVIVTVTDVGRGHEHLEGVLLINLHFAGLYLLVKLFHFLLSVAGEAEFLLVTPEDTRPRLDRGFGEHVVEDNNLVTRLVTHQDEHRPPTLADTILNQQPHSVINLFPDHDFVLCCNLAVKTASETIVQMNQRESEYTRWMLYLWRIYFKF